MFRSLIFIVSALVVSASASAQKLWVENERLSAVKIPSIAPLVERSESAVLVVISESEASPEGLPKDHPPMPNAPREGQGSGFVIHPSGLALTNYHVVERATSVRVKVGTSRVEVPARVIGADPKTDVALLQIGGDKKDWPVLPLGRSETLKVGDFVVAIGNPFGLANSVSMGILSARGRRDVNPSGRMGLYDFLQTDASINFGNSGGPLLNLKGQVVGINTAINAAAQGIGFAIPIDMVKRMLPTLKKDGRLVRSWIGVGIGEVSPELARSVGLKRPRGALISRVLEDGPADKAGILPGDIMLVFDNREIESSSELPLFAGDAGVGRAVAATLLRDGKNKTIKITLGEHPDNFAMPTVKEPAEKKARELGVSIVTLDDDDRARLKLTGEPIAKGARVVKVKMGSSAMRAGLRADDIIQKVGKVRIESAKDFAEAVKAVNSGDVLRLFVLRQGTSLFLALKKP